MNTLIIDPVGGASGNMLLGALLDIGLDATDFEERLHLLPLPAWHLDIHRVVRCGITAVHVDVVDDTRSNPSPHAHAHAHAHETRHLPEILEIIGSSGLPEPVCARSRDVFTRLAEAEATVHGIPPEMVHFHEVGALDAIVDIVGVVLGLWMLEIDRMRCGPLPIGTGAIHCAHGIMPNPAPATALLQRNVPVAYTSVAGEMVTPTGAALLVTLGEFHLPREPMVVQKVGYGAGTRDSSPVPNVTRATYASSIEAAHTESVIEIDTNLDDVTPQVFEHVMERLFAQGALDVFLTPIHMKKNRPATMLSVLARPGDEHAVARIILEETPSLGVRLHQRDRIVVPREIVSCDTTFGPVRVKRGGHPPIRPEYDDCRRIAVERKLPLLDVMEQVRLEATRILGAT